jgi:hypothetical protein
VDRYEVRERNGRHGVWDLGLARWEELDGGQDEVDETDAGNLAAELNKRNRVNQARTLLTRPDYEWS